MNFVDVSKRKRRREASADVYCHRLVSLATHWIMFNSIYMHKIDIRHQNVEINKNYSSPSVSVSNVYSRLFFTHSLTNLTVWKSFSFTFTNEDNFVEKILTFT